MAWVRAVLWLRVCAGVVFLAGAADVVPLPPGLGREGVRKGCGGKPRGNPGAVGKGSPEVSPAEPSGSAGLARCRACLPS